MILFVCVARLMGADPTASHVHLIQYFHKGVDYIFTISIIKMSLGALVSSLYGAPSLCSGPRS